MNKNPVSLDPNKIPFTVSTQIPVSVLDFVDRFAERYSVSRAVLFREAILRVLHDMDATLPAPETSFLKTLPAPKTDPNKRSVRK